MITQPPLRVLVWGTHDLGKPRTRILIDGLRRTGAHVEVRHAEVWAEVEDKTMVRSWRRRLSLGARWALTYPRLIRDYLTAPEHDVVLVCYLGHLDVLILRPLAQLRGVPVVWDQFISLYSTIVEDRQLTRRGSLMATAVYAWEWCACRAADLVLMDTRAYADYVASQFGLPRDRVANVLVGAETEVFQPRPREPKAESAPFEVLFYGQFIPLHGIDTIVRAAQACEDPMIQWTIIGQGQEQERVERMLQENPVPSLKWIPWVPYETLNDHIQAADLCLGIFGESHKAASVIPNKAFQVLSARRPLITRDSPAARELLDGHVAGLRLVPPADPAALLAAVLAAKSERAALEKAGEPRYDGILERISPEAIGRQLLTLLESVATRSPRSVPKKPWRKR